MRIKNGNLFFKIDILALSFWDKKIKNSLTKPEINQFLCWNNGKTPLKVAFILFYSNI
jgi:hypothetical protein